MDEPQATAIPLDPKRGEETLEERISRMEALLGAHNAFLKKQIETQEANAQQEQQQQDAATQQQELLERRKKIAQSLQSYEDQPALQAAINHVGSQWAGQAHKYGMAPEDIESGVMNGFERLALAALDNKMNPAHVVYQYALEMGFDPEGAAAIADKASEDAIEDSQQREQADENSGPGFVQAVQASKRPKGAGKNSGNGDSYKAAIAAKKSGNLGEYARLMRG